MTITIFEEIKKNIDTLFKEADLNILDIAFFTERSDITITVFRLAKDLSLSPVEVAEEITKKLSIDWISEINFENGFVNIIIKPEYLKELMTGKLEGKNVSILAPKLAPEFIMVEFLSPNTNKPLHLGHIRNGVLGEAISAIQKAVGHEIIKSQMINDRGIHICKSLLAWRKWGEGKTPETEKIKGDHFVGMWYIRFAQEASKDENLEQEALLLLQDWENGKEDVVKDWGLLNSWFMDGFRESSRNFGFSFDKEYFESNVYKKGKAIVEAGLEKDVFRKDDEGKVVIDLPEEDFGLNKDGSKKILTLLRSDGTGVYITQDLATAQLKFEDSNIEKSWHVVGSEQKYYFKSLFYVLSMLGVSQRDDMVHIPYGMVYLPEGKMKSREGTVVDGDDLLDKVKSEVVGLSQSSERSHFSAMSDEDIKDLALASIKFYLLRVHPENDIYFDPKESVSLDGFTGSYCMYAYARINRVVSRFEEQLNEVDWGNEWISEDFHELTLLILNSELLLARAAKELNPSLLCQYLFDLAKILNRIYEKHSVMNEDDPKVKLEILSFFDKSIRVMDKIFTVLGMKSVNNM